MSLSTLTLYDNPISAPVKTPTFCFGRDEKKKLGSDEGKGQRGVEGMGLQGTAAGGGSLGAGGGDGFTFTCGPRSNGHAATKAPVSPPAPSIVGELHIVCDKRPIWEGVPLSGPEFRITGPKQKFKLVSLHVGPHVYPSRDLPETGWRKMDGLISIKHVHLAPNLFRDVVEFTSNLNLMKRDLGTVLGMMPRLKRLSVITPRYPDGTTIVGKELATLVQTKMREHSPTHQFDFLSLTSNNAAFVGRPTILSPAKEYKYTCLLVDSSSSYKAGAYLPPVVESGSVAALYDVPKPERVIIRVQGHVSDTNPFTVAMDLISQWGHDTVIELRPAFHRPSSSLHSWAKHVMDIRLTMIKVAKGTTGPGYRLRDKAVVIKAHGDTKAEETSGDDKGGFDKQNSEEESSNAAEDSASTAGSVGDDQH